MNTRQVLCGFLLAGFAFAAFRCSPPTSAGNGSQTTNATVAGIIYLPDSTRAAGVRVIIRPKNTLADTSGLGLAKSQADTASVVTDDSGRFVIDSIDTGTYVIEAASGNNAAFIDSVVVGNQDSTVELPPDTLKPVGALKGVIRLSEGGDPRKVFVLAFGVDRFASVEADGRFKFQNLAEAAYQLRIISSLDNYGVLDTVMPVRSADTTDLGTIDLPFTGIPTPKNVTISYDTLRQIVTLTWNKADTALAKTYNVYRRNAGLNTILTRINTSPIADTLCRDSTGVQDSTYEYVVAAVSPANMEGTKSTVVGVKVVSAFIFIKNFGTAGSGTGQSIGLADIAVDAQGNYWTVDYNQNKVMRFDSTGSFISEWVSSGFTLGLHGPNRIDVDSQKNIYLSGLSGSSVQKYDSSGNLLLRIDSSGILISNVKVDENGFIYFSFALPSGTANYISKYNPDGTFNKS